jgi:GMP synthase (glutamine-hydrolysing)
VKVLVLDYSLDRQESRHIARWLPRDVQLDIRWTVDHDTIPSPDSYDRVVHTGSALSICSDSDFMTTATELVRAATSLGIPQLGICYGHQLLCRAILGRSAVERCANGIEAGWRRIDLSPSGSRLLSERGDACFSSITVFQSHRDRVVELPDSAEVIAWNDHTRVQAFVDPQNCLLGVQFHPEFDRDSGNRAFEDDATNLAEEGLDLREILQEGPSGFSSSRLFGRFCTDPLCIVAGECLEGERVPT